MTHTSNKVRTICSVALMTALLCVCSWMTVPAAVPFTMQTFAVFCSLLLLGGRKGTAAIGLYLLLGMTGAPVFSGFRGGMGHLLGPTGGYIAGFLLTALCYLAFEPLTEKHGKLKGPVLAAGTLLCYAAGTARFCRVSGMSGTGMTFAAALGVCVWPYVIPDMVKLIAALRVCGRVGKHIGKTAEK